MENQRSCDAGKLCVLLDQLYKHTWRLEALEITGEQYGILLTPMVLSTLPQAIHMEWACESEGMESDLAFLMKFIEKKINCPETSSAFDVPPTPSTQQELRSRWKH